MRAAARHFLVHPDEVAQRQGQLIDSDSAGSMEKKMKKKQEGYF